MRLFDHNQAAYDAACAMLAAKGRAAVIHPTGTGKSFIGFQLCADHPQARVCWLSPSDYIFQTQLENLRRASGGWSPENICFFTYARLMNMSLTELESLRPDYIILDEFHRCGAEFWGMGVQRLLEICAGVPVLGLSATNIRYLDNQRDMADELFEGNVASYISLGEAIARGILRQPKYVLCLYSYEKELERYTAMAARAKSSAVRQEADRYLQALRRAIDKADGLEDIFHRHMPDHCGKYIVFCSSKEHMDEMMACARDWFAKVDPEPRCYSLYTADPSTSRAFQDFKNDETADHLRLLFTINALNEGVHVPGIRGVILLRPTVSPIIYKQQIGRALSASQDQDAVIFDVVMNIEHLHSIGAIEAEIHQAMRCYTAQGRGEEIVTDRFRIIDEVRSCTALFEKLRQTLGASWEYLYQEAEQYYQEHGDLNVPARYVTPAGHALGAWLTAQRQIRSGSCAGVLTQEQIARLDAIGMRWQSAAQLQWERCYEAAKAYHDANGHLNVKAEYVTEDGLKLGKWLANLRTSRREGTDPRYLTQERIRALEALGMVWEPREDQWQRCYEAAKAYYDTHGHLNVPAKYVTGDGLRLGQWLQLLRCRSQQDGFLSRERRELLDAIGMQWESKSLRQWELGFGELAEFVRSFGNADVPAGYVAPSGYKLGAWAGDQKEKFRAGKLSAGRRERLEQLGFRLERQDPWELRCALAERYYEEHGNLNVPAKYVQDGIWLNKWLNEQKQIYLGKRKGKTLSADQIARLSGLGITWPSLP